MQNFGHSKNKFGYIKILTPCGLAEKAALFSGFLKRKMEEYEGLNAEIEILKMEEEGQAPVCSLPLVLAPSGAAANATIQAALPPSYTATPVPTICY